MQKTAVSTMKALVFDAYGPPGTGRVRDIAMPKLQPGMVLVRMHAAGVNPFDYKVITGMAKDFMKISFPYVPGMDGSGIVTDVGEGVTGWQKNDALLGMFPRGAFAQYAVIPAAGKRLAHKPDPLDFERAAALPEASLTAKTMLRAAGIQGGQTVLIIGASGGIGLYAVQLAKAQGARVIATGTTDDVDYLRDLGANDVIDYTAGDTIAQVRERYPRGADVILDVVNSGEALVRDVQAMNDGATLVSSLYGPPQGAFPPGITVKYIQMHAEEGDLDDLARRAAHGTLHVEVPQTYDLSEAARALTDLMSKDKHTRGKLVIRIA